MEGQTPIFALIKGIEDETVAKEVIRVVHTLGISHAQGFGEYSSDDLIESGASEQTIQTLEGILQGRNISLRPAVRVPIIDFVSRLEDSAALKESQLYVEFAGITTVEDLARKTKDELRNEGLSDGSIEVLAKNLQEKYRVEFGYAPKREEVEYSRNILRGYEIIDEGNSVKVNSVPIEIGARGKALPKEKVLDLYRAHSEGKDPSDIAKDLDVSPLTVTIYLRRANVIPPANSRNKYCEAPASGAPPASIFQRYETGDRRGLAGYLKDHDKKEK